MDVTFFLLLDPKGGKLMKGYNRIKVKNVIGRRNWKKGMVGFLVACMMFSFAGCGSKSSADQMSYSYANGTESAPGALADNGMAVTEEGAIEYEVAAEEPLEMKEESASQTDADSVSAPVTERKLIKTVEMDVETQSFDELLEAIQSQVTELDGYIENMNTYNGSAYSGYRGNRDANLTIRIPKENLDGFLNTVSGISNVVRRNESVKDITLTYVDLESHRDALKTEQSRLLELLEKAETVEDIITIEQRLSDVRYQLESMESQLRTYDNQVEYSTVYLYIGEVEVLTPVEEETVGERISSGFMESLDNIGEGFVEFGIWFVIHIPYLVLGAIFIAAFICLLLWLIKHSTKPPKAPKQTTKKEQE